MAISFFDMAVSITPPTGHLEPVPVLLGPNWQPNDIRLLFVDAYGQAEGGVEMPLQMNPPLPDGYTAAYSLGSDQETRGVYWRRLQEGDEDTEVSWMKPPGWSHYLFSQITVRGHDPVAAPTAGGFITRCRVGDDYATTSSVTVPEAGVMVFALGTIPDPGGKLWPSWAAAMGVPDTWSHLVATDRSGKDFDDFNTDANAMMVGKKFTAAGSTGAVTVPIAVGAPAFFSMWAFLRPAQDVTINVGAA